MRSRTWLRNWLRNWLSVGPTQGLLPRAVLDSPPSEIDESKATRFTIVKAINGHMIQIARYKPNPHGPDWTYDTYLVPEGTDMMDAIRTCITLGALTK